MATNLSFEFVILKQLPCLHAVVVALTTGGDSLASLGALAQTCRCAADRLRVEQSIYRDAFVARFGPLWSERTPWRTALRTAMRALTLRTDDNDANTAADEPYADEFAIADQIQRSAFWRQICASAALRACWADRCLPYMTAFFAATTFDQRRPLWRAALTIAGQFAAHLPVAAHFRLDLQCYLLSFAGIRRMVSDQLGGSAVRACDASICVFGLLSKLQSEGNENNGMQSTLIRDSLVHMPLWPAHRQVPRVLREFAIDIDQESAAALLNSQFATFSGKYLYGEELETDPPMLGRLDFAPFVRALFDKQIETETAQFDRVYKGMSAFAEETRSLRSLMIRGTCEDSHGASLLCGFLELDSMRVTFVKSYPDSEEGPLAWIYRGRLFPFGIGGRWSETGLPTNWSGPFLLVPGVEAARTFTSRNRKTLHSRNYELSRLRRE